MRDGVLFIVFVGDAVGDFGIFEDFLGDSGVVAVGHVIAAEVDDIGILHLRDDRINY